jgi:hypothetical protein
VINGLIIDAPFLFFLRTEDGVITRNLNARFFEGSNATFFQTNCVGVVVVFSGTEPEPAETRAQPKKCAAPDINPGLRHMVMLR